MTASKKGNISFNKVGMGVLFCWQENEVYVFIISIAGK
jgi:hypothetical protein